MPAIHTRRDISPLVFEGGLSEAREPILKLISGGEQLVDQSDIVVAAAAELGTTWTIQFKDSATHQLMVRDEGALVDWSRTTSGTLMSYAERDIPSGHYCINPVPVQIKFMDGATAVATHHYVILIKRRPPA